MYLFVSLVIIIIILFIVSNKIIEKEREYPKEHFIISNSRLPSSIGQYGSRYQKRNQVIDNLSSIDNLNIENVEDNENLNLTDLLD